MEQERNRYQSLEIMDAYLASVGLWRKQLANDGSCLFRAVAEQVFLCQSVHTKVRETCISYMRKHKKRFAQLTNENYEARLENLKNPLECGRELEMRAMSEIYKHDFLVFQYVNEPAVNITQNNYDEKVVLCRSETNQYDSVYSKSYLQSAAICQSILFELLYENVFGMSHAVTQASEMMNTKSYRYRKDSYTDHRKDSYTEHSHHVHENSDESYSPIKGFERSELRPIPPFPYKIAKALDANIYRNISLDSWIDCRREQQQKELQIVSELQFMPGDKCQVTLEGYGQLFNAHIQELAANKGPVSVFVEDLGEKHTVPFSNLRVLPQSYNQDSFSRKIKGKKRKEMPVLVPAGGRGPGLPPRLMSHDTGLGKPSSMTRGGPQTVGFYPARPTGVYYGFHPVSPRHYYTQMLRSEDQRPQSEHGHFYPGSRSFTGPLRSPRPFQSRFTFDFGRSQYAPVGPPQMRNRSLSFHHHPCHQCDPILECPAQSRGRQQNSNTDKHEMAPSKDTEPTLQQALKESLTLYELQERDPSAFPALPNRQDEEGPKSFWSGNKDAETAAQSSHQDITDMKVKNHPRDRMDSVSNNQYGHQSAAPMSVPSSTGNYTGSFNGHMSTSPPNTSVVPQSEMNVPQGTAYSVPHQYTQNPSALPYMPLLMVPHTDSMGPINFNAVPSVDRTGSDLPHNDPSTLRFFFNLGCEYYRVTSMMQVQNQNVQPQTQPQSVPQVTLGPPMGTTYFSNMYHVGGPVSASLQSSMDATSQGVVETATPAQLMMLPQEDVGQMTSQLLPSQQPPQPIINNQSGYQVPQGDGTVYGSQQPSAMQYPPQGTVYYTSPPANFPTQQGGGGAPAQQYSPYLSYSAPPNMVQGQTPMAAHVPSGSAGSVPPPGVVVYSHPPPTSAISALPATQQQEQQACQQQQQQQAAAAQFASMPPPPPPGAATATGAPPSAQATAQYNPQSPVHSQQQLYSYST